jgi:hypothetical protein
MSIRDPVYQEIGAFAAAKASEFPRTVGEFIAFYEPLHA